MATFPTRPTLPSRPWFLAWAAFALLVLTYSSTMIGPLGVNYVPIPPALAWQRLLSITWQEHGSDQRADWMGNLVTLIPFGLLVAGAMVPRRGGVVRAVLGVLALALCFACIVGIKYLQLFFPPRTVSLNYVVAQSIGVTLGVGAYFAIAAVMARIGRMRAQEGVAETDRAVIVACLAAYSLLVCGFALAPFDFVLSAEDFRQRLTDLPEVLLALPGAGRPLAVQLLLVAVGTLAYAPLGALIERAAPRHDWLWVTVVSAGIATTLTLAAMLVLSTSPHLIAIPYRTLGVVAGVAAARAVTVPDLSRWRGPIRRVALIVALPYVGILLYANGLLAPGWVGWNEAVAQADPRVFLPLFVFYIVPKGTAMFSVAAHVVMYAPVGAMVWIWAGSRARARWLAAILAAVLSAAVEFGRLLHPGRTPDFNEIVVAGFAAWLVVRLLGLPWLARAGIAAPEADPAPRPTPQPEPTRAPPKPPPQAAPAMGSRFEQFARTGIRAGTDAPVPPVSPKRDWRRAAAVASVTGVCAVLVVWALAAYPLAAWPLAVALGLYAAALWRWNGLWLVVLPVVLPALDLTPWTGWMFVGESDLFILATLAVLAIRVRLRIGDLWPSRLLGPAASLALGLAALAMAVGVLRGLTFMAGTLDTSNPYLMPENAWRLAKPLASVLLLLPFLRQRLRTRGDGFVLLGYGMVAGLVPVAIAAVLERAVFDGVLNFSADYRVVATFSSMHVGGGHIGAYAAMAMPFLAVCARRWRVGDVALLLLAAAGALYTLAVSFARMAYGAAALGCMVLAVGWLASGRRRFAWVFPLIVLGVIGGGLTGVAVGTDYMSGRLSSTLPDLMFRLNYWGTTIAMREDGVAGTLIGSGLGSYGRVAYARGAPHFNPPSYLIAPVDGRTAMVITARTSLYMGQKLDVPDTETLRITLDLHSDTPGGRIDAVICRKMLLYSDDCRAVGMTAAVPGVWTRVAGDVRVAGLRHSILGGLVSAPVELAFVTSHDKVVAFTDVHVRGPAGDVLANGNFAHGMDRWYITDDDHTRWRIKNQYLMSFFEGGLLGVAAFVVLAGAGFAGGWRALRQGDRMGAAVCASIAAFMASGMIDALLEAPRLATLFYLVCGAGLAMLTRPMADVREV